MKRRGQKEHSKQGDEQNKFIHYNKTQLNYKKENSEFKPVKLRLKIDLVSYPAQAEGLGKYD